MPYYTATQRELTLHSSHQAKGICTGLTVSWLISLHLMQTEHPSTAAPSHFKSIQLATHCGGSIVKVPQENTMYLSHSSCWHDGKRQITDWRLHIKLFGCTVKKYTTFSCYFWQSGRSVSVCCRQHFRTCSSQLLPSKSKCSFQH